MANDLSEKINTFFSKYPHRSYPKGQILVFADENPEHIFYIVSGKVRKYAISYNGDEVIVNVFNPPAFFPMSWAINKSKNSYYYKTEVPSELHIVPVEDALDFIKANPDVALDLLSRVYKGMDGVLGRMVHLMSGSAKSRLMYELIIEGKRSGEIDKSGKVTLTISEVSLAARSGLSRETISRELQKLKKRDLIESNGKNLVIKDIKTLEKKVGEDL